MTIASPAVRKPGGSRPPGFLRTTILGLVGGLLLRLAFVHWAPAPGGDGNLYLELARNLAHSGVYGTSTWVSVEPTADRLPGYPVFLAGLLSVSGAEELATVFAAQIALDLATCWLIALLASELVAGPVRARAFLLAAFCLPLANYVSNVLTETLSTFLAAATLLCYVRGLDESRDDALRWQLACGAIAGASTLVRPDAFLLPLILCFHLLWLAIAGRAGSRPRLLRFGLAIALSCASFLGGWGARNVAQLGSWRVFPPLRLYPEPGEVVPEGFHRWVRTWIVDYSSVAEILWSVPGHSPIPLELIPQQAFDSDEQKRKTASLLERYNAEGRITASLDAEFDELASERIESSPVRYVVWLPLARMASIWIHPRTDRLPIDSRWWHFPPPPWLIVVVGFCLWHVLLLGAALTGATRRSVRYTGFLLVILLIRSIGIAAMENPEPRYLQPCLPIVLVFAAAGLASRRSSSLGAQSGSQPRPAELEPLSPPRPGGALETSEAS